MRIWTILLCLALVIPLHAVKVSRAKVEIRENRKVAQLSLFLQISESEVIPSGKTYEMELIQEMKKALYKVIKSKRKLKYHKRFTHVFVTALENEGAERIAALISKTPRERFPVVSLFPREAEFSESDLLAQQTPLTVAEQIALRDS
tara:strand:- start:340 stop:780 length:441 start_codon:yes stop_codon:yes gene_type:complete